jgi:hypothetical protein
MPRALATIVLSRDTPINAFESGATEAANLAVVWKYPNT